VTRPKKNTGPKPPIPKIHTPHTRTQLVKEKERKGKEKEKKSVDQGSRINII